MITKNLHTLTNGPGVYLFKNASGEVIYVGKAIALKSRVSSYFAKNLVSGKTAILASRIATIETITVTSELEALLLEADLIKKHQPFFNSRAKDDKHPLYIKITIKDKYPRVFLTRREDEQGSLYFGPFPSSQTVKKVLGLLRNIFPFDTQKKLGRKPCFWSHIGLCDPCPSWIQTLPSGQMRKEKTRYGKNLRNLVKVLSRKTNTARDGLTGEMTNLAKQEKFEEAQVLREQIMRLDYVTQPYNRISSFLENPNLISDIRSDELHSLANLLKEHKVLGFHPKGFGRESFDPELMTEGLSRTGVKLERIECFDASHTALVSPVVGMVTFINGEPEKNLYRKFRIKRKGSQDDLAFLEEALVRRFDHLKDWGLPDLIVIDGGKGQVQRAKDVITRLLLNTRSNLNIPLIGLVKPFDDIVIPHEDGFQIIKPRSGPALRLLQRLRDEAHRFSRAYHFNLRSKRLMGQA